MLENRIDQVKVRNYRSLGEVTVLLDDLTVLVGLNGSGKSNFLDVLRFVGDALSRGLDAALIAHERAGIGKVRRYSAKGRPYDVAINLMLTLEGAKCEYGFVLGSGRRNEFTVKSEICQVGQAGYEIQNGELVDSTLPQGIVTQERNLALPLLGDLDDFKPLYSFLTNIGFYSIFPNDLRAPQKPGNPYPLEEHGENLASVLREFTRNKEDNPWLDDLFVGLARVVPGVSANNPIIVTQVGSYLVVRIRHENDGGIFDLGLESDGTLRVLGLLTAIYQNPPLPFIGIEEPEMMVHPKAMGVLCDIIEEASQRTQIILTTHSPDLISRFNAESLRLVELYDGETHIDPIREDLRQAIHDQLFSGGDLLRIGGLGRA
jgi:predicted ATPase